MFVCKECVVDKPATEFRVHKKGYRIGKCRECERQYQREWSQRDPETYRRRKRESMARRRAADPAKAREYAIQRHYRNHEASKATMRAYASRRFFWNRQMHMRGRGRATAQQLARLWRDQKGCCALTGRRLDRTAHLDHIVPLARGGGHEIANLRWLCHEANLAKRALSDAEFIALCGDVMHWIGKRIQQVADIQEAEAIA